MTFRYRYRKQILIGCFIFIVVGLAIGYLIYSGSFTTSKSEKKSSSIVKKEEVKKEEDHLEELYKVDIKGQIMTPGIYTLEKNSRVIDVIEKAGGLTEIADTSVINLSKKIWDEMVIIIYSRDEVSQFEKTKEKEEQVIKMCVQKEENAIYNDACITTNKETSGKVSINIGTLEELMTLKGIGESKAKDIINYRDTNGPFKSIEEIMNVPGIGESRFAAIKEDITV